MIAALAALVVSLAVGVAEEEPNPWPSGPPAPAPTAPLPFPQAPREPGAHVEVLATPPPPPDPKGAVVDDGIPSAPLDLRLATERTRADLYARGALDLDTALVDIPGLWLSHRAAGDARMLLRGLDDRAIDVTLDGVPLFDLGGLLPPLEQLANISSARLTLHHGPRALSSSPRGAGGVLAVETSDELRDQGELAGVRGVLGGGYGGADLEKGVFTVVDTGYGRGRLELFATLLNREDQRLGRGSVAAGERAGGVLERSGGNGGAVGARVDVVPMRTLHLFSTWQSSRSLDTPHPDVCQGDDTFGRALDCTQTRERGLDAWIVGGDDAMKVGGLGLVLHGRAHAQHGIDTEERAGTGIPDADTARDEGVRAGATASMDAALPPVALGDVWTPRAHIGADVYADRFSSSFLVRSQLRRDAEPPGDGLPDPARARLQDGSVTGFTALSAQVMADGARTALWAAGRVSNVDVAGELGARLRVLEDLQVWAALTHVQHDDGVEAGVRWTLPFFALHALLYGDVRGPDAIVAGDVDTTAWGAELAAELRPGVEGLVGSATLAAVTVDDGALFARKLSHAGVPNPSGTLTLAYDPPLAGPFMSGFFSRARFLLPQQRLSDAELKDRALCPELPSEDALANGAVQQSACTGAAGTFLLDVGAHLDVGAFRLDAVAENLLDVQGRLRNEPIGFGGTSFRAMLTLAL